MNLPLKEGECDSFACARLPVQQSGFLLYKCCSIFVLLFGRYLLQLDNNFISPSKTNGGNIPQIFWVKSHGQLKKSSFKTAIYQRIY